MAHERQGFLPEPCILLCQAFGLHAARAVAAANANAAAARSEARMQLIARRRTHVTVHGHRSRLDSPERRRLAPRGAITR